MIDVSCSTYLHEEFMSSPHALSNNLRYQKGSPLNVRKAAPTLFGLVLIVGLVVLASCDSSTAVDAPITGGTTTTSADTGTGDEPTIVYTDPNGQFSFSHPRSWTNTTQSGETVRFTGRDEYISVTIVTTAVAPLDYANQDAPTLKNASPGFQGQAPQTIQIAQVNGATIAYLWTAGPSAVTGKLVPSAANRYYLPGPNGKLAIYTYSSPTTTYDPAGAFDFANTFAWH